MKKFFTMKRFAAASLLAACAVFFAQPVLAAGSDGKILMVVTSSNHFPDFPEFGDDLGLFAPEPLEFYREFKKKGYSIEQFDIISPQGGRAPVYQNDTMQLLKLVPELWAKLKTTSTPDKIRPEDYKAIFFVGGVSCLNDFPNNTELGAIAAKIYENGGIVSGVCDGVSGLLPIQLSSGIDLVKDKKINCNEVSEYDFFLKEAIIDRRAGATVDGRVVTAYAVQPIPVAKAVLNLLEQTTSVEEIAENAQWNIAPNPAHDQFTLTYTIAAPAVVKIEITDILGNVVATPIAGFKSETSAQIPVSVSGLAAGLYTVRIDAGGRVMTKTLVVSR
jgi:putative intracellular protease/amidase